MDNTSQSLSRPSISSEGISKPKPLRSADVLKADFETANACRSVLCKVKNQTGLDFSRESDHLDHGIWTENELPPEIISQKSDKEYQAESQGFCTGTEGYAKYKMDDGLTVKFYFDNPFIGGNGYSVTIEGTGAGKYDGSYSGGGGCNATVTYTVKKT